MKKFVLFVPILFACTALQAQVGIGTTTPNSAALLHVEGGSSNTKGLLVTGIYNSSASVPDLGTVSRLMFYPGKGAFRAGYVNWEKFVKRLALLFNIEQNLEVCDATKDS